MFDLGWSEMAVIILVALVVIGPKDLPRVAREIGKWTAKARSMARDFQRSLDDMAREAELQDIKAELDKATSGNLGKTIENMVDPGGELSRALNPNEPLAAPKELTSEPATPLPPPAPAREPAPAGPVGDVAVLPAEAAPVETKQDRG